MALLPYCLSTLKGIHCGNTLVIDIIQKDFQWTFWNSGFSAKLGPNTTGEKAVDPKVCIKVTQREMAFRGTYKVANKIVSSWYTSTYGLKVNSHYFNCARTEGAVHKQGNVCNGQVVRDQS